MTCPWDHIPPLHCGTSSPQWASPPSGGPHLWVWGSISSRFPTDRSLWKALWCDIPTLRTAADLRQCPFQGVSGPSVHCSWLRFVWGPSAVKQGSTLRRYCGLTVSGPAPGGLPGRADRVWGLGPWKLAGMIAVHLLPSLTRLRTLCAGLPHHGM